MPSTATFHERVFVADLDRFLINTEEVVSRLADVCVNSSLGSEVLDTYEQAKADGESIDLFDYIEGHLGTTVADNLTEEFIEAAATNPITYDDTEPFLATLDEAHIPTMILTKGSSRGQRVKLKAAKLNSRPYLITQQNAKGAIVAGWQSKSSGLFHPPVEGLPLAVRTIEVGDDKAVSFEGLPVECFGYLLQRPEEDVPPIQQGAVLANVIVVPNLQRIADVLLS